MRTVAISFVLTVALLLPCLAKAGGRLVTRTFYGADGQPVQVQVYDSRAPSVVSGRSGRITTSRGYTSIPSTYYYHRPVGIYGGVSPRIVRYSGGATGYSYGAAFRTSRSGYRVGIGISSGYRGYSPRCR